MPQSKSDTHITPDRVWDLIETHWNIMQHEMFDPCPVDGTDGLERDWEGMNYVNPPYTLLKEFVAKAILERTKGNHSIMLLPSKTEQQWFHDILNLGFEIKFIRRRLKFKNNENGSTQPHFLVYIR